MRVAWDMQAVTGPRPTGLGVAAAMLLRAVSEHAPNVEVVSLYPNLRNRPLRGVPDRLGWEQWRLPAALADAHDKHPLDLVFSPALGAPLRSPVPVVAYVHDLIPLHYPRQFGGVAGWYWKQLLPHAWRQCTAIVVSNETVADDLVRFLGYPRSHIYIAPYFCEPEFAHIAATLQPEQEPEAPYFICVGTLEPRKNFEQAILALGMLLRDSDSAAKLHIIGMDTGQGKSLRALAASLGVADNVVFHSDYIPRPELVARLVQSNGLLFTSRYEGFGLPPLEAMSVGCPVVLSDIPPHRAVYLDPARWSECPADARSAPPLVSVSDTSGLAQIMQHLLDDSQLRKSLAGSGLAYSRTFTAERTAQGLMAAFRAVAG